MEFATLFTLGAVFSGTAAVAYLAVDLVNKYENHKKRATVKKLLNAATLLEEQTEFFLEALRLFEQEAGAMHSTTFKELDDFARTRRALDVADKAAELAQSKTKAALKLYADKANARLQDTGLRAYVVSTDNNKGQGNNQGNNQGNKDKGAAKPNQSNTAGAGYNEQQFEGIAKGNGFGSKEKLSSLLKTKGKTEADFLAMERDARKALVEELKQSL